jgi:hypothetical protein
MDLWLVYERIRALLTVEEQESLEAAISAVEQKRYTVDLAVIQVSRVTGKT